MTLFSLDDIEDRLDETGAVGFTCFRHEQDGWVIAVKGRDGGLNTRFRKGLLREALPSGVIDDRQVLPEELTVVSEEDELIESLV